MKEKKILLQSPSSSIQTIFNVRHLDILWRRVASLFLDTAGAAMRLFRVQLGLAHVSGVSVHKK